MAATKKEPENVTVGRIVHVEGPRGECLAALVTGTANGGQYANLVVFPATGGLATEQRDVTTSGWHWPERE